MMIFKKRLTHLCLKAMTQLLALYHGHFSYSVSMIPFLMGFHDRSHLLQEFFKISNGILIETFEEFWSEKPDGFGFLSEFRCHQATYSPYPKKVLSAPSKSFCSQNFVIGADGSGILQEFLLQFWFSTWIFTFFESTNFQFKNSKFILFFVFLKSVTNYGVAWMGIPWFSAKN